MKLLDGIGGTTWSNYLTSSLNIKTVVPPII